MIIRLITAVTLFTGASISVKASYFGDEIFSLMNSSPTSIHFMCNSAKDDNDTVQGSIGKLGLNVGAAGAADINTKLGGSGTAVERINAINASLINPAADGTTAHVTNINTALGNGALNGVAAANNTSTIVAQVNAGLGGAGATTTLKVQAVKDLLEVANPNNSLNQKAVAVNTALGDGNLNAQGASTDAAAIIGKVNTALGGGGASTTLKVGAANTALGSGQMNGAGAPVTDTNGKITAIRTKTVNNATADLTADINGFLTLAAAWFADLSTKAKAGGAWPDFTNFTSTGNTLTGVDLTSANTLTLEQLRLVFGDTAKFI